MMDSVFFVAWMVFFFGPHIYLWYRFFWQKDLPLVGRYVGAMVAIAAIHAGMYVINWQFAPSRTVSMAETMGMILVFIPWSGFMLGMSAGMARTLYGMSKRPFVCGGDIDEYERAQEERMRALRSDHAMLILESMMARWRAASGYNDGRAAQIQAEIGVYVWENWDVLESRKGEIVAMKHRIEGSAA